MGGRTCELEVVDKGQLMINQNLSPEVSESESNELAKLCMLSDWVNLEFISASLVTYIKGIRFKILK